MSREFITMMLLRTLEISIQEKHLTPHTNKEEVSSGFKTTARDVLSTSDHLIGQWAYELLMSF